MERKREEEPGRERRREESKEREREGGRDRGRWENIQMSFILIENGSFSGFLLILNLINSQIITIVL